MSSTNKKEKPGYVVFNGKIYRGRITLNLNGTGFQVVGSEELTAISNSLLVHKGVAHECPVRHATIPSESTPIIDISSLPGTVLTCDPGLRHTASVLSGITHLDSEKGVLRHRGYTIQGLACNLTFLQVAYLLLKGRKSTEQEFAEFRDDIMRRSALSSKNIERLKMEDPDDPMFLISNQVQRLGRLSDKSIHKKPEEGKKHVCEMIAKMPTIVAYVFRHIQGKPFVPPAPPEHGLSYAQNFLRMCFADAADPDVYEPDPVKVWALDTLLNCHIDHEMNASTFSVRCVAAAKAAFYGAIAAGIITLSGDAHGGANKNALEMLTEFKRYSEVLRRVEESKVETVPGAGKNLVPGIGHREYNVYDPRALILKELAQILVKEGDLDYKPLRYALLIEKKVLTDDYFMSRKSYPNLDLFAGMCMDLIGFPVWMCTPLFALGRVAGYAAHYCESIEGNNPLMRGQQVYMGPAARDGPS